MDFAETGDNVPVTSEDIKAATAEINKKLEEINGLYKSRSVPFFSIPLFLYRAKVHFSL